MSTTARTSEQAKAIKTVIDIHEVASIPPRWANRS